MRSMPPDRERDTGTNSVPSPAAAFLRPSDADLIADWGASLRAGGYAASSIAGATKRLEAFAKRLPDGLLRASKQDIVEFYEYRETAARRRRAEQQALDHHALLDLEALWSPTRCPLPAGTMTPF